MLPITAGQRAYFQQSPIRDRYVMLELLDNAENVLATLKFGGDSSMGQLVDGRVDVDATRSDNIWSFIATIADPNSYWLTGPGALLWLDKRVRIKIGYAIPSAYGGDGSVVYWPRGVYLPAVPQVGTVHGARMVSLAGKDKFSLANGQPRGRFATAGSIAKGTPVVTAITSLAGQPEWGETRLALGSTTTTLPWTHPWDSGEGPVKVAMDLASLVEATAGTVYHLLYDSNGTLILPQDLNPDQVASAWTLQPQPDSVPLMGDLQAAIDTGKWGNGVRVRYGSAQGAIGEVIVYETNTASPTHPNQIGRYLVDYNSGQPDPLITSAAEAQARGRYELRRLLGMAQAISGTMTEAPFLEPWDVLTISEPMVPEIVGNAQLLKFSHSLGESGEMPYEARKVVPSNAV